MVDCGEIVAAVKRGEPPSGPGVDVHVASCEPCRDLLESSAQLAHALRSLEAPSPPVSFDSVARTIGGERGPIAWLKSRSTLARFSLAAVVGASVGAAVLSLGHGIRRDLPQYPVPRLALTLGLLGGVCLASVRVVLRPIQLAPLSRGSLLALLAVGALARLGLALLPRSHAADPAALAVHDPSVAECLIAGTLMGIPLFAAVVLAARMPSWTNRLLAACAAGLLGNVVLELGCPSTEPAHLLEGHAPIVPALVSAALLLPRRRA